MSSNLVPVSIITIYSFLSCITKKKLTSDFDNVCRSIPETLIREDDVSVYLCQMHCNKFYYIALFENNLCVVYPNYAAAYQHYSLL